jgi:hypothetical protein
MLGIILMAASLASASFLKYSVDVQEFGMHGSGTILVDRIARRYVRRFSVGPASDSEGYDGRRAWIADAANNSFVQVKNSDARASLLRWASLFGDFGGTSLPARARMSLGSGDTENVVFSDFRCVELSFCPPFAIATNSQEGVRSIRVRKIEVMNSVDAGMFSPPAALEDSKIDSGSGVASVPMLEETFQGRAMPLVILSVRVNGSSPMRFLFDSGGQNILTPAAAKRLGIRTYGALQVGGAGTGTASSSFAWAERMQIGGAEIRHQPLLIVPLEGLLPDIDGVIGEEVLSHFATRFDFKADSVQFARVAPKAWFGEATISTLGFSQTFPTIHAAIDGFRGNFILDTGAGGSLDISAPFATRHDLFTRYRPKSKGGLNGMGGTVSVANVVLNQVGIENEIINRVAATLAYPGFGQSDDPWVAGEIGQLVMRRFGSFVLDYPRRRAAFSHLQ